jgi:hypothetical protein
MSISVDQLGLLQTGVEIMLDHGVGGTAAVVLNEYEIPEEQHSELVVHVKADHEYLLFQVCPS